MSDVPLGCWPWDHTHTYTPFCPSDTRSGVREEVMRHSMALTSPSPSAHRVTQMD